MGPLLEKHYAWTPYSYVLNNPLRFIDPDGLRIDGWEINHDRGTVNRVNLDGGNTTQTQTTSFMETTLTSTEAISTEDFLKQFEDLGYAIDLYTSLQLVDGESIVGESGVLASNSENLLGTAGSAIGVASITAGISSELFFSRIFETWMGKDFIIRPQSLGGNGATGGKLKFGLGTSNFLKGVSTKLGYVGVGVSLLGAYRSKTLDGRIEHTGDAIMGAIGIAVPAYGAYWGTVGKPLHNNWRENVLTPQIQMGIEGYAAVQAFK